MPRRTAAVPPTKLSMRSVAADPYRGGTEVLKEREPSAPRPVAEVEQAIRAIPEVRCRKLASFPTLTLSIPGEEHTLDVRWKGDPIALPDISFTGRNEAMAMRVVLALVPLFGAIELAIGDFTLLVDGTEAFEALSRRHQDSLAARIEAMSAAFEPFAEMFQNAPAMKAAREMREASREAARKRARKHLIWVLPLCAAVVAALWLIPWLSKAPIAATCNENLDCRSNECLPNEEAYTGAYGFTVTMPKNRTGVCTASCTVDADCPSSMRCRKVLQQTTLNGMVSPFPRDVMRCAPQSQ